MNCLSNQLPESDIDCEFKLYSLLQQTSSRTPGWFFSLILLLSVFTQVAVAQETVTATSTTDLNELQSRIDSSTELTDPERTSAKEIVRQAMEMQQTITDLKAAQETFQKSVKEVGQTKAKLQQELDKLRNGTTQPIPSELSELEKERAELETQRAVSSAKIANLDNQIQERTNQQRLLKDRLAALPEKPGTDRCGKFQTRLINRERFNSGSTPSPTENQQDKNSGRGSGDPGRIVIDRCIGG